MGYYRGELRETYNGLELHLWEEEPLGMFAIPLCFLITGFLILILFQAFLLMVPFLILPVIVIILSRKAKTYGKGAMLLSVASLIGTFLVSAFFLIGLLRGSDGFRSFIDQAVNSEILTFASLATWIICVAMGIISLTQAIKFKKKAVARNENPKLCKRAIVISILNLVYWAFGVQAIASVLAATGMIAF